MTPGNLSTHFRVDYHWANTGYISWGFTLLLRSAEHTSASHSNLLGLSEYHKVGCICICLPESSSFFVITSNNNLNIHNVQLAVDSMNNRDWIPWGVFSSIDYFPLNLKVFLSFLATNFEEDGILSEFKDPAQWETFSQTEAPGVRQGKTSGRTRPSVSKSTNLAKKD